MDCNGAGRSRCGRTGSYEVLDVSHEEAHSFLKASGVESPDAQQIVAAVGGRLMSLVASCESLEQGASIQGDACLCIGQAGQLKAINPLPRPPSFFLSLSLKME